MLARLGRRQVLIGGAAFALVSCSSKGRSSTSAGSSSGSSPAPAPTSSGATTAGGPSRNVAGKRPHTIQLEGQQRDFIVYTPEKAVGATVPAVFMLHGTSGDGEKFFAISGWKQKADAEGMIVVFPSSLTYCFHEDKDDDGNVGAKEGSVTTKWNAGIFDDNSPPCTPAEIAQLPAKRRALADHPLIDDVAFVKVMLDTLDTEYSVDRSRIYATGFSNGGKMSSRLAVDTADRFAAIAAAAGPLAVEPVAASQPIPILFSVGEVDDRFMSVFGGQPLPLDESILSNVAFNSIVKGYLTVAQLADEHTDQGATVNGKKVARFVYATSLAGAHNELQVLVIEGVPHLYPNGENHPVSMPDLLWEFFKRYTLS
jgi:polyhydroxybutyrate depolymerase